MRYAVPDAVFSVGEFAYAIAAERERRSPKFDD